MRLRLSHHLRLPVVRLRGGTPLRRDLAEARPCSTERRRAGCRLPVVRLRGGTPLRDLAEARPCSTERRRAGLPVAGCPPTRLRRYGGLSEARTKLNERRRAGCRLPDAGCRIRDERFAPPTRLTPLRRFVCPHLAPTCATRFAHCSRAQAFRWPPSCRLLWALAPTRPSSRGCRPCCFGPFLARPSPTAS